MNVQVLLSLSGSSSINRGGVQYLYDNIKYVMLHVNSFEACIFALLRMNLIIYVNKMVIKNCGVCILVVTYPIYEIHRFVDTLI